MSNSRTGNDIHMKHGPVTKLDKRNTTTSKEIDYDVCRQIMTSSLFFRFVVDLEQSRTRLPNAWSMNLAISLTEMFYFTIAENRTKKSLT